MAFYTVERRLRADGTTRYRCTVGVKKNGKYIYRENQTFSKQTLAKSWGTKRVAYIEEFGLPNPIGQSQKTITLAELITRYINHRDVSLGRSKKDVLRRLAKSELAANELSNLTSQLYIEFCHFRKAQGCSPKTISDDISYVASVLQAAKPLFNIEIDLKHMAEARIFLKQMKMVGTSNQRNRRPSVEEFELLLQGLKQKENTAHSKAPFGDIFLLSVLTCTRIGELCKIRWDDIDDLQRSVLVRDRKDPKKKTGNHMTVPLLGEAWDIVQRQPQLDERIFPFNERSITQTFRQVRDTLFITDLRYHDLRREGASRLFEAGFSIEDVAQVTGHRSLNTLWKVYREMFPNTLHEKFDRLKQQSQNRDSSDI
ncbi:site-specific recombinase XerD [Buttiauxella sp. JUb87]|jgi:integrase|uniref:tyrosine-type recombinase/integrase n=1 Tax=Buttiauxella sp. JUb87 TaxID=2485129 RepID=UPI00105B5FE2|nr:site-specific integrase [Buttiauxella sp. JUb87]TDN54660.1 site-specific recombinase XerD [Buttiauxella sp. JUb87]